MSSDSDYEEAIIGGLDLESIDGTEKLNNKYYHGYNDGFDEGDNRGYLMGLYSGLGLGGVLIAVLNIGALIYRR
jgi:hypothetical protein